MAGSLILESLIYSVAVSEHERLPLSAYASGRITTNTSARNIMGSNDSEARGDSLSVTFMVVGRSLNVRGIWKRMADA